MTKTQTKDPGDNDVALNDVRLVGRLTSAPTTVELPSGDAVITFRVSVPRAGAVTGQRVDSVPCAAWSARVRRSVLTWRAEVEVALERLVGAIRPEKKRGPGGVAHRIDPPGPWPVR